MTSYDHGHPLGSTYVPVNVSHTHTIGGYVPTTGNHSHTPNPITDDTVGQILKGTYLPLLTKQLYGQIATNPPPKEPEMSTLDKIKMERKEKREREELEAKFQAWDEVVGSPSEGDVVTFTADLSNKTYRYAALFVVKRWFLTGATTCGMTMEDFIAFLIDKDVKTEDMIMMEPVE